MGIFMAIGEHRARLFLLSELQISSRFVEPHKESMTLSKESGKTEKNSGEQRNKWDKNLWTVNKEKHVAEICRGVNIDWQMDISQINAGADKQSAITS